MDRRRRGTLAVMAIYLAANAAYFYVLSAAEVAQADLVPAELMRKIFGPTGATAVSVVAMVSIFAALNGSILTGARVPFAMALGRANAANLSASEVELPAPLPFAKHTRS